MSGARQKPDLPTGSLFHTIMLKELPTENHIKHKRRWFSDDCFDLIVWIGQGSCISGFQLCYDKENAERVFTWTASNGFSHERVDAGGDIPGKDKTPILKPDGLFPRVLK